MSDSPETWLCPVCARISVRYGKGCPHKTATSWECEHLADPVNQVHADYYRRLWQDGVKREEETKGIAKLGE